MTREFFKNHIKITSQQISEISAGLVTWALGRLQKMARFGDASQRESGRLDVGPPIGDETVRFSSWFFWETLRMAHKNHVTKRENMGRYGKMINHEFFRVTVSCIICIQTVCHDTLLCSTSRSSVEDEEFSDLIFPGNLLSILSYKRLEMFYFRRPSVQGWMFFVVKSIHNIQGLAVQLRMMQMSCILW